MRGAYCTDCGKPVNKCTCMDDLVFDKLDRDFSEITFDEEQNENTQDDLK
jgi:hypothetical protein